MRTHGFLITAALGGAVLFLPGCFGSDDSPLGTSADTSDQAAIEYVVLGEEAALADPDVFYWDDGPAAMTRDRGLREALRWIGLLRLATEASGAPRWFVEGFVHATVHPGDAELDHEFRAALRRFGIPTYARMVDPAFFRAPEGALFARSLVDHLAYLYGPEMPERIMRDVVAGRSFRDALFEHTRLTSSALELGWQEALEAVARQEGMEVIARPDTSRPGDVAPFLREP